MYVNRMRVYNTSIQYAPQSEEGMKICTNTNIINRSPSRYIMLIVVTFVQASTYVSKNDVYNEQSRVRSCVAARASL